MPPGWAPYPVVPGWPGYPAPPPPPPVSPEDTARTQRIILAAVGGAVPLLSCGFASFATMGFFAAYRRSWWVAVSAVGYLALNVFAWTIMTNGETEEVTLRDNLAMMSILVTWVGGIAQGLFLGLDKPSRTPSAAVVRAIELRVRREQARHLLARHPDIAKRLHIGRPDLAPAFDDGGLVDVNSAPAEVLAAVPGISAEQARHIVAHRAEHGPLLTVDHLAHHRLLPAQVVDDHRDVLVALA
ncbi:ComEA family DNA-binding protein [Catellatospora bangladeshensis]|uniref:ComEA family DNA-binding protein n=1 Tax=Catellatospora bangladeshensis TaxID=310355 RepID=UPI003607FC9B